MATNNKFEKSKGKNQNWRKKSSNKNSYRRNDNTADSRSCDSMGSKRLAGRDNDASWYNKNAVLTHNVANLSFNNALGGASRISWNNTGGSYVPALAPDFVFSAPGIMSIYTAPSVGFSVSETSAVNLAAKNFYSWIRHANSGHSNYESPEIMMYLLAMDQIYSLIAYMTRAYGVARVYSQINRYVGDALISAMGLNPTEIRSNLSDFRSFINMYITKASAFVTPNTMDFFKRHYWMYSGVYKDEEATKSQMYMYVPAIIWQYNDAAGSLDAGLFAQTLSSTTLTPSTMTLSYLMNIADVTLGRIIASEDMNIISGDILKAYPDSYWKLDLIPEDYAVFPVYSEEVLSQIHNTVFTGPIPTNCLDLDQANEPSCDLTRLNVTQDKSLGYGVIMHAPQFKSAWHLSYDAIVDFPYETVDEDKVLVATRNIIHGNTSKMTNRNTYLTNLDSIGSDIPMYAGLFTLDPTTQTLTMAPLFTTSVTTASTVSAREQLTQFNQRPVRLSVQSMGANATGIVGELDNYTVIDVNDVNELHDVALLSMFAVPYLGTGGK